jgi:hypothetical protein
MRTQGNFEIFAINPTAVVCFPTRASGITERCKLFRLALVLSILIPRNES